MLNSNHPSVPSAGQVDSFEPSHAVLAKDRAVDDCLPCRLTGAGTFIGLAVYSYFSGHAQLKQQQAKILKSGSLFGMKSRQLGISGIAMTLVGLGLWRLVN